MKSCCSGPNSWKLFSRSDFTDMWALAIYLFYLFQIKSLLKKSIERDSQCYTTPWYIKNIRYICVPVANLLLIFSHLQLLVNNEFYVIYTWINKEIIFQDGMINYDHCVHIYIILYHLGSWIIWLYLSMSSSYSVVPSLHLLPLSCSCYLLLFIPTIIVPFINFCEFSFKLMCTDSPLKKRSFLKMLSLWLVEASICESLEGIPTNQMHQLQTHRMKQWTGAAVDFLFKPNTCTCTPCGWFGFSRLSQVFF